MEEVRQRIGIPVRYSPRNHNEVSSTDSFRHFARAYGDDNPLYNDPGYASSSTWGSPIAPPLYPFASGVVPARRAFRRCSERSSIPAIRSPESASTCAVSAGSSRGRSEPVTCSGIPKRSTRRIFARAPSAAGPAPSCRGGMSWEDEDGDPFALRFLDFWHADREKSRKAGKNRRIERPHYSDEDLARIDAVLRRAASAAVQLPAASPTSSRGSKLGPIAKGPLSVTDMVAWHVGVGWGMYGGGTSRIAYANRQRVPKFYVKNDARVLGLGAALPLGRRVGAAHGPSGRLRLRRDADQLDGPPGHGLDGRRRLDLEGVGQGAEVQLPRRHAHDLRCRTAMWTSPATRSPSTFRARTSVATSPAMPGSWSSFRPPQGAMPASRLRPVPGARGFGAVSVDFLAGAPRPRAR